jgi:thiamine biosynthesis lipoprotein
MWRSTTSVAKHLCGLLAGGLLLVACGSEGPVETVHTGEVQGTTYTIRYWGTDSVPQSRFDAVFAEVDAAVNLWDSASCLSEFSELPVDAELRCDSGDAVFTALWPLCDSLHGISGGRLDPTVGPLVRFWKAAESDTSGLAQVRSAVGWGTGLVRWDGKSLWRKSEHVELDFNAVAQGHTVDLVVDVLRAAGVQHAMVEIGGEVRCLGLNPSGEPWRIGIERPDSDPATGRVYEAVVPVADQAICTSGSYRKFKEVNGVRRSHAIDPLTGRPVEHGLLSVTVAARTAAIGDGLATALLVAGLPEAENIVAACQRLHPEWGVAALFIEADGAGFKHSATPGWKQAVEWTAKAE